MDASDIDSHGLRKALGCFATGVTVITTESNEGERVGFTANSFTSVSLDPPIISWNYRCSARNLNVFLETGQFAINVLAADQQSVAQQFCAPLEDRFAGLEIRAGQSGVPLIGGCSAHFECKTLSTVKAGDHVIFLGQVLKYQMEHKPPLVFFAGDYVQLGVTC